MAQSQLNREQLLSLLEASKLLNSTNSLAILLDRIIDAARSLSSADRATLYLVDYDTDEIWTKTVSGPRIEAFRMPLGVGIAGRVAQTGEVSNLRDAHDSEHFNPHLDKKTGYHTKSLLTVPFFGRDGRIAGVIQAINHERGHFEEPEKFALQALGDYVALALENAMYVEELREKRRMEDDLVAARQVQHNLLPHDLPQMTGFELSARYIPCLAVGGDCYDAMPLPDQRMGMALGDISGKGLMAAMMMANLQAMFRLEARRGGEPHQVMNVMNKLFYESTEVHHFATFFYGIVDPANSEIRYCSAGHEPMVVLNEGGEIRDVPRGGMLLGMFPEFEFETQTMPFYPGDTCVVYSDGVTEQQNSSEEMFERDRLVETLQNCRRDNAAHIGECVENSVREFAAGRTADDDFTLIVLRRSEP